MAAKTQASITSIFTPPSSCLERTYTLNDPGTDSTAADGKGLGPGLTVYRGYSSECFPPQATLSDGYVYLSPGLCPSAYSIASSWTEDQISYTETYATCCPWYMHASSSYWDCGSFPESTSVVLKGGPDGTPITSAGYAFDTPIFIAWQASDLSKFEHHPTATGSWNVPTGIPPPLAGNGSIPQPSPSAVPINKGLSTGAKAGTGVGAGLGVLTIIGIAAFVLWRRKSKKSRVPAAAGHGIPELSTENQPYPHAVMKGGGEIFEAPGVIYGVPSGVRHEMSGEAEVSEADGRGIRAELEGDQTFDVVNTNEGKERGFRR